MLPDNILFSTNPANDLSAFLQANNFSKVGVLVDENTRQHCYPLLQKLLPEHFVIEVKSGEEQKNLTTCTDIWKALTNQSLDRHACLVVLGGGVLGDMGGFCAATYKRGITFVLVPTTLLAQVDASIGGKLGVDFDHYKNHIGVFQEPALTLLSSTFLKTLPAAEIRSGFAEIVKHTLIADADLWHELSNKDFEQLDWDVLIKHSVNFKARITTEDPKEKGLRKILNAGHTIGHAVESYLLGSGNRILHGEAIAVGLITESWIAHERALLTTEAFTSIYQYLLKIYDRVPLREEQEEPIAKLTLQDKKNMGNKILCVLQQGIGKATWDNEITLEEVKRALSFYRSC